MKKPGLAIRSLTGLLTCFGWMLLRLCWFIRVEGAEHIPPHGPVVVIANHPSYLDPAALVLAILRASGRNVSVLAWDKLFAIPLIGAVMRAYGAKPVNLQRPGREPWRHTIQCLSDGGMIGIFPEGGRSESPLMGEFKPGALRAAATTGAFLLPVSVIGAYEIWNRERRFPRFFRRVTIRIHPPRLPADMGLGKGGQKDEDHEGEGARDKTVMRGIEAKLRAEMNAPLLRAAHRAARRRLRSYRHRTPARLAWKHKAAMKRAVIDAARQVRNAESTQ